MSDQQIIVCRALCKHYGQDDLDVEVLKNVNFSIGTGESVAIMGASGSGKSTLLHLLGGLDKPTSGDVLVDGHLLSGLSESAQSHLRNRVLGFVYQFHHLLGEFSLLENVGMPLLIRGCAPAECLETANAILGRVGLSNRVRHKPGELSGGERQRAAIARALVTQPKCVLADEPTGNLDRKAASQVVELMQELNEEFETSFLVVTHDLSVAEQMGKIVQLEDGQIRGFSEA
ncbi:MAG: lipoprotein-releasing ABC transporter ATP-binding protein LolD [Gammaproteobacteria bacterium]|nr:MAG: lipoprotein-releasing ABC transporter ATP-binding protein LolD [Gammaproteobacteria bacterium]